MVAGAQEDTPEVGSRYLNILAALKKSSYPQVPGSIPAANTSTQIHMDLSK